MFHFLQPKVELAKMLTETVKYITDKKVKQAVKTSRSRRRSEVQDDNIFASSTIVYAVGNVTPFSDRLVTVGVGLTLNPFPHSDTF